MTTSPLPDPLVAVVFDVGDTLVHSAPPATAVQDLVAAPRPDVVSDLGSLRDAGVRLAAVTDTAVMTEADVRALLATVGLDELLEVVVTSVDVGAAKPDPTSLRTALDRLGVRPHQALYIGDRVIDQRAALAAGTEFAFVRDTIADTIDRWVKQRTVTPSLLTDWVEGHARRRSDADHAASAAREKLDSLAKPVGSLGRLEDLAVRLASIAGSYPPPPPRPAHVVVFAADHGVHAEGVSAWPQEITTAMVEAMAGRRASINALSTAVGAEVSLVDVGVAGPPSTAATVTNARVRGGTRNLAEEAAVTLAETTDALAIGADHARRAIAAGAGCLVTGEMGIANTTAATAIVCAVTGRSPDELAGRGAGADDDALARKRAAISRALARTGPLDEPLELLASLGGLEIAAMAGFIVAGATSRVPVVVDGLIADAALLCAEAMAPGVADHVVAGHRSVEPAATAALEHLGLRPLLDLDLRLGEGTGAVLAVPLLDAAARLLTDVVTIAELTGDGEAAPG